MKVRFHIFDEVENIALKVAEADPPPSLCILIGLENTLWTEAFCERMRNLNSLTPIIYCYSQTSLYPPKSKIICLSFFAEDKKLQLVSASVPDYLSYSDIGHYLHELFHKRESELILVFTGSHTEEVSDVYQAFEERNTLHIPIIAVAPELHAALNITCTFGLNKPPRKNETIAICLMA